MKKKLLFTFYLLIAVVGYSQTYVKGGIYSNITWTKANSPYIITDTVVVFPNDTLTIQSGVTIKFYDNQYLDIRGYIVANGSPTDSIIFTSNSTKPKPGIYAGICSNGVYASNNANGVYSYCCFKYSAMNSISTLPVLHCSFISNTIGLYLSLIIKDCKFTSNYTAVYPINGFTIDSCIFKDNTYGVDFSHGTEFIINHSQFTNNYTALTIANSGIVENSNVTSNTYGITQASDVIITNCIIDSNQRVGIETSINQDTIKYSTINYNGIGIQGIHADQSEITNNTIELNDTGIIVPGQSFYSLIVSCNSICDNKYYNVINNGPDNFTMPNNYWCLNDSASIRKTIYDGYTNIKLGLIIITPYDTIACDSSGLLTSINNPAFNLTMVSIYPNPSKGIFNITTRKSIGKYNVIAYNIVGEKIYTAPLNSKISQIDLSNSPTGLYLYRIIDQDGNVLGSGKLVKE